MAAAGDRQRGDLLAATGEDLMTIDIGVTDQMEESDDEARKFCQGCQRWRPRRDFSFKDTERRSLRSQCRRCCSERSRRHYVREKESYLERNRRRRPLERRAAA